MVSDGEEGKDRGSALTGSFERPKAGVGHENKAGKMLEDEEAAWWKSESAQTVGVVDERSEIAACYAGNPAKRCWLPDRCAGCLPQGGGNDDADPLDGTGGGRGGRDRRRE